MIFCSRAQALIEVTHERNEGGINHPALALAYDGAREILQLEFRSRAIYHYHGVPAAVHEALLCAPFKGSYFNRVIRGRFPYAFFANAQTGYAVKG